jgi:hypothetical protein
MESLISCASFSFRRSVKSENEFEEFFRPRVWIKVTFICPNLPPSILPNSITPHTMSSPSSSDEHSVTGTRPEQGAFTTAEKEFLTPFLAEYLTFCAASRHGDKKKWVQNHPYPSYMKKFQSDGPHGPNLSSLLTVRRSNFLH